MRADELTRRQAQYWNDLAAHPLDTSIIDPRDSLGLKNRYLSEMRSAAIADALRALPRDARVLDFGCGTGSLSAALVRAGYVVLGVDIAAELLARTPERQLGDRACFVRYDGARLPLADGAFDAATTYVVLNHIVDDAILVGVLRELHRVLRPNAALICIEQIRRREHLERDGLKRQRTVDQFCRLFAQAGFRVQGRMIVRYGHFPTTPLIRFGLVPTRCHRALAATERSFGRLWGIPWVDYADVRFELERTEGLG